ncbi:MAG: radical SAM protein [Syntrophobacteraceae bacterium]
MAVLYRPGNMLLQWHITERCNLRCAHCYQSSFADDEMDYIGLLAVLEQFKELLISWKRQEDPVGVRGHLTVTGGEPFLRPDFMDLLRTLFANRGLFTFAILTNGSFIDHAAASRLKKLTPSFVQVSMEGGRETHDRIRGPGTFDRAVSGVRRLVKEGVRTFISFTAHRDNYLEFPVVVDIARRLKVARVWADRFIPPVSGSSRADDVQTPCTLSPLETLHFFRLMHQARGEKTMGNWFRLKQTEVAMHRGIQFLVGGGVPYRCTAGDSLICILPNGDVYPCRRMPVKIGNVLETPLAKIYHGSDILHALRDGDRIGDGCRKCFFARACRGGLRCLSYALSGSPFEADPGCWLSERARASMGNPGMPDSEYASQIF